MPRDHNQHASFHARIYSGERALNMKEEWAKEVRVRAFIQRILSIDLQQQLFHAECQIEASWLAEELRDAEEALFAVKLHDLKEDSQWREREKQRAPKSLFCVCMNRREKGWANVDLVLDSNDDTYSLTLPNLSESDLADDALQAYNRSRDELRKRRFKAPRLALANVMKFGDHEKWLTIHSDPNRDHAPIVCYRWKVSAVFQQHMKLSQFPFDQQDLSIELQAGFEYDKDSPWPIELVENVKYKSLVVADRFVPKSEYKLCGNQDFGRVQLTEEKTNRWESASEQVYSRVKITVRVQRRRGYWLSNVVAPLFIVSSSLFATFVLPVEETNDRLAASLTILLAMVTFKTVVSEQLPKISYLTWLDYYVIACFLAAFAVILAHVLARSGVTAEGSFRFNVTTGAQGVNSAPRTAVLSHVMIGGGALWLLLHVVAAMLIALHLWYRRHHDSYWHEPEKALWVGGLCADFADADRAIHEEAAAKIRESFTNALEALESKSDEAGGLQAMKRISKGVLSGKQPTPERERLVGTARGKKSYGDVKYVRIWSPEEAREYLREGVDVRAASLGGAVRDYVYTSAFAVVVFEREAAVKELTLHKDLEQRVKEMLALEVEGQGGAKVKLFDPAKCRVEKLEPDFVALSERPRKAGAQRKGSISPVRALLARSTSPGSPRARGNRGKGHGSRPASRVTATATTTTTVDEADTSPNVDWHAAQSSPSAGSPEPIRTALGSPQVFADRV